MSDIERSRRMAQWHFQRWLERDTLGLPDNDEPKEADDGSDD